MNPNHPIKKAIAAIKARWLAAEYPGGEPVFQTKKAGKDLGYFTLAPLLTLIIFKACDSNAGTPRKMSKQRDETRESRQVNGSKSQIIDFTGRGVNLGRFGNFHPQGAQAGVSIAGLPKKAPGALVKLRLMNVVETYSTAPVHAQIVDEGLGKILMGGTLIGDANPDVNFDRINISFRFARDPNREGVAIPISARALSLDGTLGLDAQKKEGFFARSMMGSAVGATQNGQISGGKETGFKEFLIQALTSGLIQEMGSSSQIERNRAQVLSLKPATEFFAELTDFFPGSR